MRDILCYLKMNDVEYEENVSFIRLSTIRLGGTAALVAIPDSITKLVGLLRFLSEKSKKYKVIGKMSNILPPDGIYDGVLIKTTGLDKYYLKGSALYSECGVCFPTLTLKLASLGIGGFEELSGIPGTVGGLVAGNAGAFGKEIADVLIDATVYDPEHDAITTLENSELGFLYRNSIFKKKTLFLLAATFKLRQSPEEEIKKNLQKYREIRREKQPCGYPSLGSTFKHPKGLYASKLIDDLGLKGYTVGGSMVSEKHAGFIVNCGNATSTDVKTLVDYIEKTVYQSYGIRLEREIEYL